MTMTHSVLRAHTRAREAPHLESTRPAPPGTLLAQAAQTIREADLARRHGFVCNLIGLIIEATGLQAEIGEVCMIGGVSLSRSVHAPIGGDAHVRPHPDRACTVRPA